MDFISICEDEFLLRYVLEKFMEDRVGVEIVLGKVFVYIFMIIVVVEIVVFSLKFCYGSVIVFVKSIV